MEQDSGPPGFWHTSFGRSILRNASFNYVGTAVRVASGLLLTPFLLGRLGETGFGLWVLALTISGYFGLLDFGIGAAVVRAVANSHARDDQEGLNAALSSAFLLLLGLGAVCAGTTWIFSRYVHVLFVIPAEFRVEAVSLVWLVGLTAALGLPLSVFGQALRGFSRYDYHNTVGMVHSVLYLVATLTLISAGFGIVVLGVIHLSLTIGSMLVHLILVRRVNPRLSVTDWRGLGVHARGLLGFGFMVFVFVLSGQLTSRSAEIVVGSTLGVAALASYAVGRRMADLIQTAMEPLGTVMFPEAVRIQASRGHDRRTVAEFVAEGTKLCLGITLPLLLVVVVTGRALITLWVGAEHAAAAYPVACLLGAGVVAGGFQWPSYDLLMALGHQRWLATTALVKGLVVVGLSVVLAARWGLTGVAAGSLLPILGFHCVIMPLYVRGRLVLPAWQLYGPALRRAAACALPALGVGLVAVALLGDVGHVAVLVATMMLLTYGAIYLAAESGRGGLRALASGKSPFAGRAWRR